MNCQNIDTKLYEMSYFIVKTMPSQKPCNTNIMLNYSFPNSCKKSIGNANVYGCSNVANLTRRINSAQKCIQEKCLCSHMWMDEIQVLKNIQPTKKNIDPWKTLNLLKAFNLKKSFNIIKHLAYEKHTTHKKHSTYKKHSAL